MENRHWAEEQMEKKQDLRTDQTGEAGSHEVADAHSDESDKHTTSLSVSEPDEEDSDYVPTSGWPKTIGEGDQKGYIYKWAGNIAHLDDRNMSLPDMQDIKVLRTKGIQDLRDALTRLASTDATTFAEGGIVHTENDSAKDRVIEGFRLCNLSICRIRYTKLDYEAKRPYATSALAKKIRKRIDTQAAPGPSLDLVQWFIAKILQSNNGKAVGKAQRKWSNLRIAAQQRLWLNRDHRADDIAEMMKGSSDDAFLGYFAEVKKNLKRVLRDEFQQFECLKAAVADESICRPILGRDIAHIVDKNNKMIAFVFTSALQKIFAVGALENIQETFDRWSHYQAMPKPDRRHPLHEADFLARNPQFDLKKAKDPHCAKAYVEHYGIHGPVGHQDGSIITKTAGHRMDRHMKNELPCRLYPSLQRGGFRVATEAVNFFLEPLCPDVFQEYADICRLMDQDLMVHTRAEVETFPLHAILGNVATQDHVDDSDAAYGVAGIVTFGDFEGADLVLWQLGLRISFGSGSVCMLRGHELSHSTTDWHGKSRSSIVEAMPAAVKRAAARKLNHAVEMNSDSEHSCPGHEASYTTPEEEEIDVYRFQTYDDPRERAANADLLQIRLHQIDEQDRADRKRKREQAKDGPKKKKPVKSKE